MCLPGLTFGFRGLDSFPWHLMTIGLLGKERLKKTDIFLLFLTLTTISMVAVISHNLFEGRMFVRQFINYASIIIGGMYLFHLKPKNNEIMKVLLFVSILNFIIAFLQNFYPSLTFFSNARYVSGGFRGEVGLFPEPTAYGFFNAFCFMIGIYCRRYSLKHSSTRRTSSRLIAISLLSILLLNNSSGAVLVIAIFLVLSALISPKKIIVLFLLILTGWLFAGYFENTRIYSIIKLVTSKDIFYLLAIDGSINSRLADLVGPYYGLFKNYSIPNSTFDYMSTSLALREDSGGFFWFGASNKIMNYTGTIIYELSFLGLVIFSRYVFRLPSRLSDLDIFLAMFFLLNNSLSLSHGYILFFPLIVRNIAVKLRHEQKI